MLGPMFADWHWPLLFATGLAAGFVDSIAGGGGLITVPVLLNLGVPPSLALGTNKLQACFCSGSASWHYAQAKAVDARDCAGGFLYALVGAALGTLAVQRLDPTLLRKAIPVLLLAVALYSLGKPAFGNVEGRARLRRRWFDLVFGLGLGFYDGFFGPGTGTFWAMAFMLGLGFNLTRATAYTKVMNFASNLSSLGFFLLGGKVLFAAGLVMGAGQWLGARLGSGLVVRRGAALIRPVFISVVLLLTLKLLFSALRDS